MNILMVAYEGAPFYKRGGLGDVVESLPKALSKIRIDVRVVIPYYNEIRDKYNLKKEGEFSVTFESEAETIGVYSSLLSGTRVPFYFLSNAKYLFSSNPQGKNKRIDQFAFFNLAVVHFMRWCTKRHKWTPSVVHCNDWHTALIPLILRKKEKSSIPTLLTIHNLLYQGVGSLRVLDLLNMKDEETKELKRGNPATEINILGEGIIHATRVSTVSRSYAKEIIDDYNQNRISVFLKKREEEQGKENRGITGILNGIDYDIWNPVTDESIFHKYNTNNWETGKKNNKQDLLKDLELADRPTFCFIGRMANQKGIDILIKVIDKLESLGINIIILGAGSLIIEESVLKLAQKHPGWVRAESIYSEELAHKLYASSDFIIVPSRYEPCGLIQMIAMRYGTIPIASKTGGLKDSIHNGKNGFLFRKDSSRALLHAVKKALNIYNKPKDFAGLVLNAMKTDFSWDKSALLYKKLYKDIINSEK